MLDRMPPVERRPFGFHICVPCLISKDVDFFDNVGYTAEETSMIRRELAYWMQIRHASGQMYCCDS